MTHIHLLCTIADMMDRPAYLEIGVGDANCFKFVSERCRVAHAVDVRSNPYGNVKKTAMTYPCASFWEDGSDKFFELYAGEPFNLIFIDGSHWAEQVRRDWKNSLTVLAPNGFVVLHDTWSPTEDLAASGSDTAWQVAAEIENDGAFEAFTLPIRPGLTLARPKAPRFQ